MAADRLLSAGADADGNGYTISLSLENGRQISIRIPPVIKIVEDKNIRSFVQTVNN
jgi:hypothetical protein